MKVRVAAFTLSIDGFGAGRDQSEAEPLGVNGETLHEWLVHTETFRKLVGGDDAKVEHGDDDDRFARRSFHNIGAWIMGPPYHVPIFVLTHHARPAQPMAGGTVFHFVTGGIHEALRLARAAADGKDVRIGGGVQTVRQYLQAGLIDEMHLAISPRPLGQGESLLQGIDLNALGLRCTEHVGTRSAMHVVLGRTATA
jgi:dihydrofolate reductase